MSIDDGKLVEALILHDGNRSRAAAAAGCSRRTIQNRLQQPEFLQKILEKQAEREERLSGAVDGAVSAAFEWLTWVITHEEGEFDPIAAIEGRTVSTKDKMTATKLVLDHAGLLNGVSSAALAVMASTSNIDTVEAS